MPLKTTRRELRTVLVCAVMLALGTFLTCGCRSSDSVDPNKPAGVAANQPANEVGAKGIIAAVNSARSLLDVKTAEGKLTFKLDDKTLVRQHSLTVDLSALKPGQEVQVAMGPDKRVASRVEILGDTSKTTQ